MTLPVRLRAMMGWLFGYGGYFWPTNMFFLLVSVAAWFYTQPPIEACTEFRWDWMSHVFLRPQVGENEVFGMGDAASYRSRSIQTKVKALGKCRSLGCGNLADPDHGDRVEVSILAGARRTVVRGES